MFKFQRRSGRGRKESTDSDSSGTQSPGIERALGKKPFILPQYWINHEDSVKVTTLQIKLPGCKRECIKIKIWNKRQLHVLAASEVNRFKLQFQLPREAKLLGKPFFSTQNGVLTCRLHGSTPQCVVCGTTFSREFLLESKDLSGSVSDMDFVSVLEADPLSDRSSFELVEPRFWITYDDNMALFEAHLEGCKHPCQIKFVVANHSVMLLAVLSAQRRYFLELRLESSAKGGWKCHFDPQMEIFTCTIPLLGHYECSRCIERHQDALLNAEKDLGVVVEEPIELDSSNDGKQAEGTASTSKTAYCESNVSSERDMNFSDATDQDVSSGSQYKSTSSNETTMEPSAKLSTSADELTSVMDEERFSKPNRVFQELYI